MHITVCFLALGNERCVEIGGYAVAQPIRSYQAKRDGGCRSPSAVGGSFVREKKENPFVSAGVGEAISGLLGVRGFVYKSVSRCKNHSARGQFDEGERVVKVNQKYVTCWAILNF